MLFSDIIGQDEIKQQLIKSVKEGRVSHAQLFFGQQGTGKLALAIAYAQYISCQDKKDNDSCGVCKSCYKYQRLIHPDLHFAFPIAAKSSSDAVTCSEFLIEWREALQNNIYININEWLDFINAENKQGIIYTREGEEILRKLSLKAFESEYKILIIWMPERMHVDMANKLLKLIEEPPNNTVILMVSENENQLLPTIRSRAQMIKIPLINDDIIYKALAKKYPLKDKELRNIVRVANGSAGTAIALIENSEEYKRIFNEFVQFMRLCFKHDILKIIDWVDDMAKAGREKQKIFLKYAIRMIRENFVYNVFPQYRDELVYMTDYENEFSVKFSKYIHVHNANLIMDELNKAHIHIERNGYNKIVFLDSALKIMPLLKIN